MLIGKEYKFKFLNIWFEWKKVIHKNINYGSIIANELSSICHYEQANGLFKINYNRIVFDLLIKLIFTKKESPFVIEKKDGNILFLYEEDRRSDYRAQCNYVYDQLIDFDIVVCKVEQSKKLKNTISIVQTFSKTILIFKLFLFTFKSKKLFSKEGIRTNFYLYLKCLEYHDYCDILDNFIKGKKFELLITFCDVKEYASILTQVAKKNKILTCTQQHAIYVAFNDTNFSQPVINYLNFQSDYLLGWGNSLIKNWANTDFDVDKIIIAGTNLSSNFGLINYELPEMTSENSFAVILSAEYGHNSNKKMILMAEFVSKKYNYKYKILFHPTNNIEKYKIDFPFLEDKNILQNIQDRNVFILENKFLMAHITSMYLNVLRNKRKCFRFVDEHFIDIKGIDEDRFGDIISLENLIRLGFEMDREYIDKINQILEFHYGSIEDNYSKAIIKIIKKEND